MKCVSITLLRYISILTRLKNHLVRAWERLSARFERCLHCRFFWLHSLLRDVETRLFKRWILPFIWWPTGQSVPLRDIAALSCRCPSIVCNIAGRLQILRHLLSAWLSKTKAVLSEKGRGGGRFWKWLGDVLSATMGHLVSFSQYTQEASQHLTVVYSDFCTVYKCACSFSNTSISGARNFLKYSAGGRRLSGGVAHGLLNVHSGASHGFFLQENSFFFLAQFLVFVLGQLCLLPRVHFWMWHFI